MKTIKRLPSWLAVVAFTSTIIFAAEAPTQFEVGGLNFKRPANWGWVNVTSAMRKAQLRVVDDKTKNSADIVFFAGLGGSVKENVDRWFTQFQEPREKINAKTEERTAGKHKITFASAQGTYLSGMPGGAKTPLKDHALLGAIIETAHGNIFVRMTGPTDLVQKSTAEFKGMMEQAAK